MSVGQFIRIPTTTILHLKQDDGVQIQPPPGNLRKSQSKFRIKWFSTSRRNKIAWATHVNFAVQATFGSQLHSYTVLEWVMADQKSTKRWLTYGQPQRKRKQCLMMEIVGKVFVARAIRVAFPYHHYPLPQNPKSFKCVNIDMVTWS